MAEEDEKETDQEDLFVCLFVGWLLNVPATG